LYNAKLKIIEEIDLLINQDNDSTQASQEEYKFKPKEINKEDINKKKELLRIVCTCGMFNPKFKLIK
jgi:hypothetical protein